MLRSYATSYSGLQDPMNFLGIESKNLWLSIGIGVNFVLYLNTIEMVVSHHVLVRSGELSKILVVVSSAI